MIDINVDLNWLRKQLQDRVGLTQSEAGELIRSTMIAGEIIGVAPTATRLPKMSVRSHLIPEDGLKTDFAIPAYLWAFIDVDWEEINPCFNFQTDDSSWIIHKIEIDRASAHDFLKSQDPSLHETQPAISKSINAPTIRKEKGGRPREYDWDEFTSRAEKWMRANGKPNTLAELVKNMAVWFKGKEPADSSMKKYLRPIYRAFESGNQSD